MGTERLTLSGCVLEPGEMFDTANQGPRALAEDDTSKSPECHPEARPAAMRVAGLFGCRIPRGKVTRSGQEAFRLRLLRAAEPASSSWQ
jgi:hypothetical protein